MSDQVGNQNVCLFYVYILFSAGCEEDVVVRRGNIDMILAVPHGGICINFPFLNRTYGCHNGTKCAYNHDCYVNSDPPDPTQCKTDRYSKTYILLFEENVRFVHLLLSEHE